MLLVLAECDRRLEADLGVETTWKAFRDVNDCIEWLSGLYFLYCLIVQAGELHVEVSFQAGWNMDGCILFLAAS